MSGESERENSYDDSPDLGGSEVDSGGNHGRDRDRYRDEVFSKRVPAGKRTYFFDVKTTRSGEDFFITITESKRVDEGRYEKHKLFLYKEDLGKFVAAMHEVARFVCEECLPDYDFRGLPDISLDASGEPPPEYGAGESDY